MKSISPDSVRIGWIGTGIMGKSMCRHLQKAGYKIAVYNRTKSKAEDLLAEGASWSESPEEVAKMSDIIVTMLGFPADVRQVYLGEQGMLTGAKEGSIVVDMTTSDPTLAKQIYREAKARNVYSIDAPVSGGDVGAREARLSIMVGGDQVIAEHLTPLFRLMGNSISYMGPAGAGQNTKLCNQILISTTMIGVVESLLYGFKAGLNLEHMISALSTGAAACWSITNLAPRIIKRNFDPGFLVEHFVKDMGIVLDESRRMNLALPGLSLAYQFYVSLMAQGKGKMGTHALALVLEQMNNMELA